MNSITFVDIYSVEEPEKSQYRLNLFELLGERQPNESISHKEAPSWQQHLNFIASKPYKEWCVVLDRSVCIGSYYITHQNEIGISVYLLCRKRGYASQILYAILQSNPGVEFRANINPVNEKSKKLFHKFGFKHVQDTFVREPIEERFRKSLQKPT